VGEIGVGGVFEPVVEALGHAEELEVVQGSGKSLRFFRRA